MIPDDDTSKRAVPAAGVLITFTYEGPFTWPRKRLSTETVADGDEKAHERLELIDGKTRPVTYIFEGAVLPPEKDRIGFARPTALLLLLNYERFRRMM